MGVSTNATYRAVSCVRRGLDWPLRWSKSTPKCVDGGQICHVATLGFDDVGKESPGAQYHAFERDVEHLIKFGFWHDEEAAT